PRVTSPATEEGSMRQTLNELTAFCTSLQRKHSKLLAKFQAQEDSRIAQSSALPPIVDEPASPVRDDSQGEACPINSGFIADQDRATIAKSSTLPLDSAPRVTSPSADEGTQEVEIDRLKERVKILKDKRGVIGDRSGDDAPIKGRRIDEEKVKLKELAVILR
nr:hypothetical protein [Tanacetum cinerariifolium]